MIFQYPSHLPCFRAYGYRYGQQNTIKGTEFESGYVRARRDHKNVPQKFKVQLLLTTKELDDWEGFVHNILKGVGWFSAQVLTGRGLHERNLQLVSNDWEPELMPGKKRWMISFEVRSRKQNYQSEEYTVINGLGVPVDFGTQVQGFMEQYYV